MTNLSSQQSARNGSSDRYRSVASPTCLILFDCPVLAHRAKAICRELESLDENVLVYSVQAVNLGALGRNGDGAAAASSAAMADLIFLAIQREDELPEPWKEWFLSWANFRMKPSGHLYLLTPDGSNDRNSTETFFEQIADLGRMAFLSDRRSKRL